ncbi:LysE family translocator [Dactylosporangium aurantiacum]|uniref:LysE family translocator n=1 Tax=Dactylosporangium aurantiacum TaxID=35754 RepID=A0A9Q9ILW5_9ACTN|nr:LysE family translocator [Dactylosporangium aurantiacum]MDG6108265.1 LysE family translocator [Dactylosporangium aurantiacum]UWZ58544.1 LysE family translocator [Dactylosporangium aurantiacum]
MTTAQVLAFGGVVALGAMSPGPDFAVVVRRSALAGRAHGVAAALGVAAGVFAWAIAAATGVAALVTMTSVAFTVIKVVGAGYLVYLGVNALRSAWRSHDVRSEAIAERTTGSSLWGSFRAGLLCNTLNPKAAIFFVALLPQFLPADAGLIPMLALSLIAVVITAAWFLTVANLVAAARRVFSRPATRRLIGGVSGTVLIGFGVRLAFTTTR